MERLQAAVSRMPRCSLSTLPTPLERLGNLEKQLGHQGIYIKRDDMTGLGPGGNKLRSLEFLCGDALQRGKDILIGAGPVQSNLCTLTAAAAAKLGLRCLLVCNGDEPEQPVGNVLLNRLLGAETHFIGPGGSDERNAYVEALIPNLEAEGAAPYFVRNGATSGVGALGYVNAVLEMAAQVADRQLEPLTIFAPGGNGGVAAGLIYGNALAGFPFRIVVISVEDNNTVMGQHILEVIGELEELLGLPFAHTLEEACTMDDSYMGEGWSVDTPESRQAVLDFPKLEGILIENVYNSKVMVGMVDYLRQGKVSGNVCYLHTGGFGSLFSQF